MKHNRILHFGGAGVVILALVLITVLILQSLRTESRRTVSAHTLNALETMAQMVRVWENDYKRGTRAIAGDQRLIRLVQDVLAATGEERSRRAALLAEWLQPVYRSRGFQGHSVITADGTIVAASSPAFIGKQASAETRHAITVVQREGAALTRPIVARYHLGQGDSRKPVGTVYQLSCTEITNDGQLLAMLCLRLNAENGLYDILRSARFDQTGEVYLIDRDARMLSPSRFLPELVRARLVDANNTGLPYLWAREPTATRSGQIQKLGDPSRPMTQLAARLMQQTETGFVTDYRDYRGVTVVGAARWLPGMDMGLVVEQDDAEAFGPYRYAASAIIVLCVFAAILVLALTGVAHFSRQTLAARERRFRSILEHVPATFHLKDRNGCYLLVNPAYAAQIGLEESSMLGRTDFEVRPKQARETHAAEQMVLQLGTHVSSTAHYEDRDGHSRYSRVVRFPVWSADRSTIEAIGTAAIDITEQEESAAQLEAMTRNLEALVQERTGQLAEAKEAAEAAGRAKADFLANMSHEIRTPMNAIIGLSDLALRLDTGPKEKRYLERIHSAGRHLLALINNILDFSKIEAGKVVVDAADFSLEQVLEHVVGLVVEAADRKGLELLVEIDPAIPDALVGDALRVGQILINLANNAVKFTETGHVLIRAELLRSEPGLVRVRFVVADTGIGIAEEHLARLFQSFQQVDSSATRRYAGTGLGLAISRRLAELLGGTITVDSRPGNGSRFALELDLVRGIDWREEPPSRPPATPQRALVIEPQPLAGRILAELLRRHGWMVTVVQHPVGGPSLPGYQMVLAAPEILATLGPFEERPWRVGLMAHGKNQAEGCDGILEKPVLPGAVQNLLLHIATTPTPTAAPTTTPRASLSGLRVLLVEDNPINEEVAAELLQAMDVAVSTARNGRQAVDAVAIKPFDLVLMDVHMPDMDGLTATRLIRQDSRFAALPIIALTASAFPDDRAACLAAGMTDHLPKPIVPDQLFEMLARWSGRQATVQTEDSAVVLPDIPGLDLPQARQQLLGRSDLLLRVLLRVKTERRNVAADLRQAWALGDTHAVSALAHDTAGIAGTIGAQALRNSAAAVETALAQDQPAEAAVQTLLQEIDRVIAALDQALP